MRTWTLFALAALAFSTLAGAIEALLARRAQQRLQEKSSIVLHRLAQPRFRNVRNPLVTRALQHVGLFFGFLLATYVGWLVLRIVHNVVSHSF
jgi:hypothetical protein